MLFPIKNEHSLVTSLYIQTLQAYNMTSSVEVCLDCQIYLDRNTTLHMNILSIVN